uniref:RAVE complex protein Rav1 C-terminal domain-containing protein n=1 Tax=Astatotilapia calliptera TaxID=8154 RepID=A0AAX7URS3_ASTCA
MNLHQVLTGAVNPGDNCFSVGSVNNVPFTAYASGCDVVILGSDFERLQIIPGAKHGNIQVGCVDCSLQGGQVRPTKLNCQWQKTGQFVLQSIVRNLAWHPTGCTLLTGSSSLQLWSNVDGVKDEADERGQPAEMTIRDCRSAWRCIWQSKTASPVNLMKFSPDGEFFATAGQDDCLIKVWYSTSKWKMGVTTLFTPPDTNVSDPEELAFSFIYLAHPRSVTSFSWRKTSKYMPRGAVCNVLLTCCKDSVCRLWAETLLPGDSLLSGHHKNPSSGQHSETLKSSLSWTSGLPHLQSGHCNHKKSSNNMPHANALCHFHIAASINPATDIPLLPSISSLNAVDDEEPGGPFSVHWLNNKELHFTLAMEVFLQQLRISVEQQNECSNEDDFEEEENRPSEPQGPGTVELPLAAVEHQLDVLLEEWNKGADMLFSIHPMDGSLLVWHVDWLDEYHPGMFRQAQVSFASRIPVAFPAGDAISLSQSVVMYACNKNVDLAIQHGRQRPPGSTLPQAKSALISYGGQGKSAPSSSLRLSIFTPNVLMISKHADGSLNQWAVSFAEDSAFSTVLSVSHKSRYCGHRFHLNDLACHSLLPLLLTTSHHNALRTPEADSILVPPEASSSGFSHSASLSCGSRPTRVSLGMVSQDPNAIYSELILWRVDPVGPLSLSGGVSELARINSLHASAFANVAWLPTLIPSSCLGLYCNSPSACFVASDGQSLRLYQAVIEAKKLLSELSNPEISKYVGEVFNIISQQSTAKPGCIIELDAITDFQGKETQLLHVFEEHLILGTEITESIHETPDSPRTASSKPAFSARFFLVVVELSPTGRSLLHMWHLHLAARPVTMAHKDLTTTSPLNSSQFVYDAPSSPVTQKSKSCTSNLQSACRLSLTTHRLYSQELALPAEVEAISVTPSAGHLSASCSLPAGHVPYLLATFCSDGKVRFWRCNVMTTEPPTVDNLVYQWEEWPLLVEEKLPSSSAVSVPGRPIEVSCCHAGRFAVAYKQMPTSASSPFPLVHIGIFQCESTGGSQWILEQTIVLDNTDPMSSYPLSSSTTASASIPSNMDLSIQNENCLGSTGKSLVHLDWVSQEDGSHILTVGIGTKIYIYGRLSGKPPDLGVSSDANRDQSLSRLVLLRSVSLFSSVEGSPPIPVSLSWVRDGILVVGMECEMHVYSQWQPPAPPKPTVTVAQDKDISSSVSSIVSAVRQCQEEGLSPGAPTSSLSLPKKTLTRSMTSLAQKLSGKKTAYDLPVEMEDSGLFEAAHQLFPTLPQYHPVQLLELMDLGKVHRAKAILSHLVKCIAGEIITLQDSSTSPEKRVRSRTISVGGSTATDQKMFSKAENSSADYTEISSIPPLPLYALLGADDDTPKPDKVGSVSGDSGHGSSHTDAYDELFHTPNVMDLDPLDSDQEKTGNKVIDLSQYSPTYFGPEHAQVLSSHLLHSSLPGLTRMEQMSLMALADTIASTSIDLNDSQGKSKGGETLDECGLKFLLAVRLHTFLSTSLPPAHRAQLLRQGLSTCHYAWGFHSEAEEELLNMLPAMQKGEPTWPELRSMGVGWWLRSTNKLRRCIEKVAKASFQRNNDPLDAAIFYLALKKKAVVWGLYRSQKNAKMTEFFHNNFSEDRWRKAALKNAFSLLGKQRFQHSAAFFLLAGSLKDAVEAIVFSVLIHEFQIPAHQDPFLRSMAYWVLEDYSKALDTLLEQKANIARSGSAENRYDTGTSSVSACNPEVFNFYTYLRTHPLLLRRHFGSSNKAKVGLTAEVRSADSISLDERRLFFTAAYAHLHAGCPMLALEVLSKMPKVRKHSRPQDDTGNTAEVSVGSRNGQASDPDWCQSALNGYESDGNSLSNSRSDSVLSFDWSQPSVVVPDEPLELKWDSDKDDEENDEDEEETKNGKSGSGSVFHEPVSLVEESEDSNDYIEPSDDILVTQLKFAACLKIMTNELRTLSTGYELDGGKLRYQLCLWLEREVLTYTYLNSFGDVPVSGLVEEEQVGVDSWLRRHWLQSNQPLLRMFLSYCSLHGSHGGGLASVRMELILLLQESHQVIKMATFLSPTSIPLLMACTTNVKTVVANPLVYLTNLTHDILQTISALDSPPHPDVVTNEIYVMHTLAASLSACIYQCLCDGHTYSHVNHFTGTVYQSVLLSQKQPLKTISMDESVQPNTSPAQWPGIASLIRLLSSAGEESQPGLAVLLCEILTAVFLSLFVHGMTTHSCNELFRIMAHPLNSKLWVTVFGGGARIPVIEKLSSPTRTPPPGDSFGGCKREGPLSPKHHVPVVEQEAPSIFKEQFVPPELSIWDYFIAKPSLPPSENRVDYDSEASQGSEDEDDDDDDEYDDVFDPNSPQREHSNHNSYSWCLMRLAMVQLVLANLKSFYLTAGYDLLDLPVASPLCHAVLKTLQRWEQVLQKRLEIFGGPPSKYISTHLHDEIATPGPALLRHKTLFEASNTPFRSSHHSALPVKRLWHFLVKQEEVQETFIRNIFTKKPGTHQTESDQGSPGGKARIIHKESDIITAFAINKANRNCLVMASTHDIQELDVSSILATQILTWIDDDEAEAKGVGGDDFLVVHTRDDFAALHGTTPYTHSNPGTPINVPWLGGMQTGRGAAVMIKRNINNVRRMTSHPTLPYYLTGAQDGSVRMFEWGHSQQIICFRSPGNSRVTRIRFNHQGNKFGIVDADGALSLWQTNTSGTTPKPYLTLQCHNKTANDFLFVGSSSLIATAGLSTDNRNVCLWDTLVTPANSLVQAFSCHESGATVLSMAPRQQLLITGGRKGWISVLELSHKHQRQSFQAHDSPVKALAVDPTEDCFISGSAEGNIKVWSLTTHSLLYSFPNEHARQSLFRNLGTGVMQLEVGPANYIFSCGADGTMKMRILPNRFSVTNNNHGNLKNDVKFFI